jgi:hypothetical protein
MSTKRAPRVGFALNIVPKWRARLDLARMMTRQLSKRFADIRLYPGYLFRNSVLLVTLHGEKFVVLVREDKYKYPGHKDRMWQILISPYKFRSPAAWFPEDEQERYAKDLMAISREVHAVLSRTPTVRRLRWWFVGWDVNQPGARTPAELPWCVDAAERPDTGTRPSTENAAAAPFAHRAIAVTAHTLARHAWMTASIDLSIGGNHILTTGALTGKIGSSQHTFIYEGKSHDAVLKWGRRSFRSIPYDLEIDGSLVETSRVHVSNWWARYWSLAAGLAIGALAYALQR